MHAISRPDCHLCPARHLDFFSGLNEDILRDLRAEVVYQEFPRGHLLYEAGTTGQYVMTLHNGLVKLNRDLPSGETRIVRILKAGDSSGLEIMLNETYRHTSVALTAIGVCMVPASLLLRMIKCVPEFQTQLMRQWQRNLEAADSFLSELATGPAQSRVARLLLYLNSAFEHRDLPALSREDMGDLLGITTETASRVMAEFRRQQWIRKKNGQLQIHRPELLHDVAAG